MITQEDIRDYIRCYKESVLSVRELCFNKGISRFTFYYRLKKHREKEQSKKFIPIITHDKPDYHVNGSRPGLRPNNSFSPEREEDVFFELVYPNGAILRVKNSVDLLLQALVNLVNR